MNGPTDWGSALAILGAGLLLGVIFVYFYGRRRAQASLVAEPDLALKDLHAKRDALIRQLRDLDENVSPAERTRLELETAEVLRQIDSHESSVGVDDATDDEAGTGTAAMNPALKGFLWGAASFLALAGLGWFVMQSATPREEGGSVTGGTMSPRTAPNDPMIEQMRAAVLANPDDLRLRNDFAQALLERDDLMGVFEQTKYVLERSPDDSRSLTYQGLVRLAMGEAENAASMLQRATQSDPKNLDSWVALAWVYAQSDRMNDAEKMIAEAAKQSPQDKARLEEVFQQMKTHVAQMASQPAGAMGGDLPAGHPPVDGQLPTGHPPVAGDLPAGHPPMAGTTPGAATSGSAAAAMARPAPPSDGRSVKVTLKLDPAAKSNNGILYVMARPPAGGPPVAVKRIPASSFPMTFEFGSADSMMGQPLPDRFILEARLDSDGDAATKPPTDPSAVMQNVAPGGSVELSLK